MLRHLLPLLVVIALLTPNGHAASSPWASVLQFLIDSAEETDRLQTEHWIRGTKEAPVFTPKGLPVWETNPLMAGRPGELDRYIDFWRVASEELARNPSPLARTAQMIWAAGELYTVINNNRYSPADGLPRYWMLSYRWRF